MRSTSCIPKHWSRYRLTKHAVFVSYSQPKSSVMSWIGAVAASRGARANRAMTAIRRKSKLQQREDLFEWNDSRKGVSPQFEFSADKDRIREVEANRELLNSKRVKKDLLLVILLFGLIAAVSYAWVFF